MLAADKAEIAEGLSMAKAAPEAMWVFSSDACGTYDLPQIRVTQVGRTQPVGVIILISEKGQFNLPRGTGMLLRINQWAHRFIWDLTRRIFNAREDA
jgi:hypothetical protein